MCADPLASDQLVDPGGIMVIALGANLGEPLQQVSAAAAQLALRFEGVRCSSWWRSEPVNCPPGSGAYVNGVLLARRPDLEARAVLAELQLLERSFGSRDRSRVNAPRMLDLDLILFGGELSCDPDLVLPHPRALQRAFVLLPLAQIAPDLRWPADGRSVAACAAAVPRDGLLCLDSPGGGSLP